LKRVKQTLDSTIAVIADIHGNRWALEAVLADIDRRQITQIVNLGDSVLGPVDPVGTANLLIARNIPSIRGNDDRVLFALPEQPSASQIFTRARLTEEHLAWLRALPTTAIVADELFLCHGTPTSDETYLLEEVSAQGIALRSSTAIRALLTGVTQPVVLCGHSHLSHTVYLPDGTLVVNPGSVGLPAYIDEGGAIEAGSPHARYALLAKAAQGWQVEHIVLPYDWELAASAAREHNRPDWATWIATGRA
jgi:predicted phosphodiesterase